jgi:hypothetical protein
MKRAASRPFRKTSALGTAHADGTEWELVERATVMLAGKQHRATVSAAECAA